MPDGFIGNSSKKYLTSVSEALSDAHAVHSKDPYNGASGGDTPPPPLPSRSNQNAEYSPDTALSGGYSTGVGNETNVVLDQDMYEDILLRIRKTDSNIAERLHDIILEIEEMCETIYIVPSTLPKYLRIVDKVKASLSEFQSLSEQVENQSRSFVNEIVSVDGR